MGLTVKIFLGMEYECPRGHRFMTEGPDKPMKHTGSTSLRGSAAKILNNDMPLYMECPRRNGCHLVAQLMRIHVVTPKAPLHVTIYPQVQPCTDGPIFYPGWSEPIKLPFNSCWVLRLPFIYCGTCSSC